MGHRRFRDRRIRRRTWRPVALAQEVDCDLFVYRVATWRHCDNDSYNSYCQFDNRLQCFRNLGNDSAAAGSGCIFDLVFEAGQEQGLDQPGSKGAQPMKVFFTGILFLNSLLNGFAAIGRVANSS